jgi:hypothetical protein
MRFLLKVNIPVDAGNAAAKAGVHLSAYARRLTNPRDCRALVPRLQRQRRDPSGHGP